jgi:hypothetical protein
MGVASEEMGMQQIQGGNVEGGGDDDPASVGDEALRKVEAGFTVVEA